jgi:hypothetical protein
MEGSMFGKSKKSQGIVIARLEGTNQNPASGALFFLAVGALAMIVAVIFETSAIRLAAWGAIWTGWNVLFGIGILNQRRTDYVVYREISPD